MRGEYLHKGIAIPNNLTTIGRAEFLAMAFRGVSGTAIGAGGNFFLGLCTAVPSDSLTLADLVEPTIGVNGYARVAITRDSIGWPTVGTTNLIPFIETIDAIFAAVGGDFDQAITRCFLTPELNAIVGDVYSLSEALIVPLLITPATLIADRTFNYRVYER